jgi:hypothetical protein
MKLKDGCPGCNRLWRERGSEGQCSTCKRCLYCHDCENVPYSCAARHAMRERLKPGHYQRSERAYNAYHRNEKILPDNERGID